MSGDGGTVATGTTAPERALQRHRRRSAEERTAWRAAITAFVASRALVVTAGVVGVLAKGTEPGDGDAGPLNESFGRAAELLTASTARYDSGYYLSIVVEGYDENPSYPAFFPLYPLATWGVKPLTEPLAPTEQGAALLAGIAVSCVAFVTALYLLHRLVTVDYPTAVAHRAVALTAFFPMSFYFSAVYSESLFLLLSVGAVYAARLDHWPLAGICGSLAVVTRSTGVVLLVPLVLMLRYGPRPGRALPAPGRWRPRFPVCARRALWLVLLPVGLVAVWAYFWRVTGDPGATTEAQSRYWDRHLAFPVGTAVRGMIDAAWATNRVKDGFSPVSNMETRSALSDFGFAVFVTVALVGSVRRLPFAYSAYALSACLVLLVTPVAEGHEHFISLPRYAAVLFPVMLWLALWTADRRRYLAVTGASAVLLAGYTALFATGHWVA